MSSYLIYVNKIFSDRDSATHDDAAAAPSSSQKHFGVYLFAKETENRKKNELKQNTSSGLGRRSMFKRSWVRIPATDTRWTFFTFICCKVFIVCLKRPKINKKRSGIYHF